MAEYARIQKNIKRFPRGNVTPSLIPPENRNQDDSKSADAKSPDKRQESEDVFKKIIESSMADIQDEEIKRDINYHMEHILKKRIEDKAESFEKNVLGNSLEVMK